MGGGGGGGGDMKANKCGWVGTSRFSIFFIHKLSRIESSEGHDGHDVYGAYGFCTGTYIGVKGLYFEASIHIALRFPIFIFIYLFIGIWIWNSILEEIPSWNQTPSHLSAHTYLFSSHLHPPSRRPPFTTLRRHPCHHQQPQPVDFGCLSVTSWKSLQIPM